MDSRRTHPRPPPPRGTNNLNFPANSPQPPPPRGMFNPNFPATPAASNPRAPLQFFNFLPTSSSSEQPTGSRQPPARPPNYAATTMGMQNPRFPPISVKSEPMDSLPPPPLLRPRPPILTRPPMQGMNYPNYAATGPRFPYNSGFPPPPPPPPPLPPPGMMNPNYNAAVMRNPGFQSNYAIPSSQSQSMAHRPKRKRGRPPKNYAHPSSNASPSSSHSLPPPMNNSDSHIHKGMRDKLNKDLKNVAAIFQDGFTGLVLDVGADEDIVSKITDLAQGPRTVSVLSATGIVSNATLRQPTTLSGTVKHEGRLEILYLSGSYSRPLDNNSIPFLKGGLTITLAGPDGRIVGGGVLGPLKAAETSQIIVATFIPGEERSPLINNLKLKLPEAAAYPLTGGPSK